MISKFFAALLVLVLSHGAMATSVSFLYGDNFNNFGTKDQNKTNGGYERQKVTMTIENFGVWEYGTVFFYYDITEPFSGYNGDSSQFFGSIAPTFSWSKMFGMDFGKGVLRDISFRAEVENGSGYGDFNFRNYFYGLQYDLAIPGFDFFSFNTVIRDNPLSRGVGFQLGMFWQMSQEWSKWRRFKFTGFLATSPWDGDQDPEAYPFLSNRGRFLTTQPQLLWDLGNGWFGKPNRLEVGVEYAYFLNRYTIRNVNEKVMQGMVKLSY